MNDAVRSDFPLLERALDGKPICYLDSAATALKPRSVVEAEVDYLTRYTANVHRGRHALSEEASAAFENARQRVARFVNAEPDEIVFVANATSAINLVAGGLGLTRDDAVVVPCGEHHSNLVPWMRAGRAVLLDCDPCAPLAPERVAEAIERHRPRVFAFGHASNVSGVVQPAAELARLARARGALTCLDAAQSAPHVRLDVRALGCDFVAFSGHKMLGPTGIGVLWGRRELLERLAPASLGGGTIEKVDASGFALKPVPMRLEAGTPNISGAIGLAAAIDYLEALGWAAIEEHERRLSAALDRALDGLPGVRIVRAAAEPRLALACVVPLSSAVVADHLALALSDSHQMMVRSGFHCAQPAFARLGVGGGGALRVSGYLYNTVDEIAAFGSALRELLTRLLGGPVRAMPARTEAL